MKRVSMTCKRPQGRNRLPAIAQRAKIRLPQSSMADKTIIPIYFDYASTLCYVAWRIVSQIEAELPIEPLWKGVPIRLRDHRSKGGRDLEPAEREKVAMVAAETGIPVVPPERWLDSDAALQGAELAREAGAFSVYHDLVFRAAFESRFDIGDLELLAGIAERVGMDRAQFIQDLRNQRMAARIEANQREADDFCALGYPTFMLGDFPLIGIQPIETMRLLIGRFIEKRAGVPGG
jgi:predicted DsbA family dithiol-disulfide isomerase